MVLEKQLNHCSWYSLSFSPAAGLIGATYHHRPVLDRFGPTLISSHYNYAQLCAEHAKGTALEIGIHDLDDTETAVSEDDILELLSFLSSFAKTNQLT
jgi:hypothetical protein